MFKKILIFNIVLVFFISIIGCSSRVNSISSNSNVKVIENDKSNIVTPIKDNKEPEKRDIKSSLVPPAVMTYLAYKKEVKSNKQFIIVIDAGHQKQGNNQLEPIGPGATEKKPKVSSGTTGVATKKPEYVLNLEVSLKLRDALKEAGYKVIMVRETHNVNISNKERSEIANKANADLFIRIHADGDTSPKVTGFSVLYPSKDSKYTKGIYASSKLAADKVYDAILESTKSKGKGTVARSDLTGFNWSKTTTFLLEMGFMTNKTEDIKMSDPKYQDKMVNGIVNGVNDYFKK